DPAHHAQPRRHLSGHLHGAVRRRTCADAVAGSRDEGRRFPELGDEEGTLVVTAVVAGEHEAHPVHRGLPPPPGGWRRLLYPGFIRAAWMTPLFFGIGCGIVVLCRWWGGWHPIWFGSMIVLVAALISGPVGFLAGIGAFDYWAR